jgi:hypothetical protein
VKLLHVKKLAGAALSFAFFCLLLSVFSCAGSFNSINYERKYPRMVANVGPVSAGTIEAEFDRTFSSKLKSMEVEVIFYPRLNSVALEFRRDLLQYRQFWDEDARRQFTAALEIYKEDYATRKFIDRHRKTRAVYGKVKGQVEWETFRYSRIRVAYPAIELGYRFVNKMPFFATFMPSMREISENGDTGQEESQQISIFFTRAQADELIKLFDQSYLMTLVNIPDTPESVESKKPVNEEDYREWGE